MIDVAGPAPGISPWDSPTTHRSPIARTRSVPVTFCDGCPACAGASDSYVHSPRNRFSQRCCFCGSTASPAGTAESTVDVDWLIGASLHWLLLQLVDHERGDRQGPARSARSTRRCHLLGRLAIAAVAIPRQEPDAPKPAEDLTAGHFVEVPETGRFRNRQRQAGPLLELFPDALCKLLQDGFRIHVRTRRSTPGGTARVARRAAPG